MNAVRLFALLLVTGSVACASVVASAAENAEVKLGHKSLYQAQPVAKAHRIEIAGSIKDGEGEGTIMFDGNSGEANAFGDIEISTAVNCFRRKIKFTRIEATDKLNRDREVYEVTGDFSRDLKLRLVIDPKTSPSTHRLVVIENDKPTVLAIVSHQYAQDYKPGTASIPLKPRVTK